MVHCVAFVALRSHGEPGMAILFHDSQNSCCSLLQCVAMCHNVLHVAVNSPGKPGMPILFDDSRNSVLQCVAVNSLGDPLV